MGRRRSCYDGSCVRWIVAGIVGWGIGCGDGSDAADVLGASSTGDGTPAESSGVDEGSEDTPWEPLSDLPIPTQSCEERGTHFGIVAGPKIIEGAFDPVTIDHVAAAAGPGGLLTTYARSSRDIQLADYFAIRIGFDGSARGSSWTLSIPSEAPAGFSHDDRLLLTYCDESHAGWRAFEVAGNSLGSNLSAPAFGECTDHPPTAAWTDDGYLVAWRAAPAVGCESGCIALALGNENVVFNSKAIADAAFVTDPLAIAVTAQTALVVAPQIDYASGSRELLAVLLEHSGAPLFPPIMIPIASDEPVVPGTNMPVGAAAGEDDGFLIVVGGRGGALGRVRLDAIASVVEEYEELALPDELGDTDAFRSQARLVARTGGFVAYGLVTSDSLAGGFVLLMLDPSGDITSYELFGGATSGTVVSHENRTYVVLGGNTLAMAELGCVF